MASRARRRSDVTAALPGSGRLLSLQVGGAGLAGLLIGMASVLAVVRMVAGMDDPRLLPVFGIALLLGATFVLGDFGFAGGFRALLIEGDTRAVNASLLIPAVAALAVIPGGMVGQDHGRYVAEIGPMLVLGASVFGVGMQLANGCGSGTLVAAGQGSRRMWVALPFFCAGGVLGSLLLPTFMAWPTLGAVDLPALLGPWGGLAATLALLTLVAAMLARHGGWPTPARLRVAALIGALAGAMFLVSGQPWGVTMGLTLAGAKVAAAIGLDPSGMQFWSWDGPREAMAQPLLAMHSALSDAGVVLGALLAASATGQLRHRAPLALRPALAAALGGLLMGVGARLSWGCNIGAFVGGVSSGSLHGFVWLLAVLPGCWLGIRLRPRFGMAAR